MPNYLSIVLRSKFTLFYRFGEMIVPQVELLPIPKEIGDDETRDGLLGLLKKITLIEYTSEALVLHLTTKSEVDSDTQTLKFDLIDIKAIYPFTKQAKSSISKILIVG